MADRIPVIKYPSSLKIHTSTIGYPLITFLKCGLFFEEQSNFKKMFDFEHLCHGTHHFS